MANYLCRSYSLKCRQRYNSLAEKVKYEKRVVFNIYCDVIWYHGCRRLG
jgi:hypothetical protein